MELAKFKPIIDNLQERAGKYYKENKAALPDNRFFNSYFPMPEIKEEAVANQNIFDAKEFFKRSVDSVYKLKDKKDVSALATSSNISIPKKDSIAYRHNNP